MAFSSNRIEVADALECIEHFYRENMTDGLLKKMKKIDAVVVGVGD